MKKSSLIALTAALLLSGQVFAQQQTRCSYSPLQEAVQVANSGADIDRLVKRRVNLNAPVRCGGTLAQLAIVRGNPEVLAVLINSGVDIKAPVKSADFNLQGVPEELPLILFAAYRAPNTDILKLLMDAGLSVTEMDKRDENISWYLERNPVLRSTDLARQIDEILLFQTGSDVDPEAQQKVAVNAPVGK